MRSAVDLGIWSLVVLTFSGCDKQLGSAPPKPEKTVAPIEVRQPFPDRARVETLATTKVEAPLSKIDLGMSVDRWSVTDGWAESDYLAKYAGSDPDSAAFATKALAQELVPTASMTCVAHEMAKFQLATGTMSTTDDVRTFIQARCGVPFSGVAWSLFNLPKLNTPIDAFNLRLEELTAGTHVGAAIARNDERGVLVVVHRLPTIALDPIAFDAGGDGKMFVRGSTQNPTEWIQATVSHGTFKHASCTPIPIQREGGFAFECPTKPEDAMEVVEVTAAPQGSLIGSVLARAMFSPAGSLPLEYVIPELSLPVPEGDFSPGAIVAAVNTLRTQAEFDDVRTVPAQNEITQNLLPLIIGSQDVGVRNEATLGLLAGWQTEATIRGAGFQTAVGMASRSLAQQLAASMFSPSFRAVVMDPEADLLSVGTLLDTERDVRALLLSSYEEFEPRDFTPEKLSVLAALDSARARVGLEPVVRVEGSNDEATLQASAERIRTGEGEPRDELNKMLQHFVETAKREFRGAIFTPIQLEGWTPDFPDEFFKYEKVAVVTAVTYFKPKGAAWGQHVIFMIYTPL